MVILRVNYMLLCLYSFAQSCPTLCIPTDGNPPGSSVHGTLQAGILEWVAMPSSRRSSDSGIKPVSPALQADSQPGCHPLAFKTRTAQQEDE